jgi:hypothetical protein
MNPCGRVYATPLPLAKYQGGSSMRTRAGASIIALMTTRLGAQPVRIVLELDPDSDRPTGRLVDERGSARDFSGWLQLMDGLDGAMRRSGDDSSRKRNGGV